MPYKITDRKTAKPWKAQKKIDGKKFTRQFATKKEALAWESDIEKNKALFIETPGVTSVYKWAVGYLDYAKAKFVHKTYLGKAKAFRLLAECKEISPEMPVKNISPAIALMFLTQQFEQRGGTAANNYRKDLHAAWEWGIDYLGMPLVNPFHRIKKFANRKRPRVVPSLDDFWKVYEKAESGPDRGMLLLYLQTAARKSELFRLKWADVDFENNRIRLISRKNKTAEWTTRHVFMTEDAKTLLTQQKEKTGTYEHVFINPSEESPWFSREKWMPRLCKEADVAPFGLHGIRHLAATIMANENVPLVKIQKILGHGSITTTEIYIKGLISDIEGIDVLPTLKSRNKQKAL